MSLLGVHVAIAMDNPCSQYMYKWVRAQVGSSHAMY